MGRPSTLVEAMVQTSRRMGPVGPNLAVGGAMPIDVEGPIAVALGSTTASSQMVATIVVVALVSSGVAMPVSGGLSRTNGLGHLGLAEIGAVLKEEASAFSRPNVGRRQKDEIEASRALVARGRRVGRPSTTEVGEIGRLRIGKRVSRLT